MHFVAQIKRGSTIDRMWRAHHRLGGEVSGVLFATTNISTGAYVSKQSLHADAITDLIANHNIELIATGIPLPEAEAAAPDADDVGKVSQDDVDANLMQAPPVVAGEPDPDEDSDEDPAAAETGDADDLPDTQDPVAEEPEEETKEPAAKEPVAEEAVVETPKPKNTGGRRNR